MRTHCDFRHAKRNPHVRRLETQVTIRVDDLALAYFEELSRGTALPCQTLINLFLRDCAADGRRPRLDWNPAGA